jgi:hypothetical protein
MGERRMRGIFVVQPDNEAEVPRGSDDKHLHNQAVRCSRSRYDDHLRAPDCALVRWYRERMEKANGAGKKTFIVALARKLLIVISRFVTEGIVPEGMRFAKA